MLAGAALTDSQIVAAVNAFRRAASKYVSQGAFAAVMGVSQQNVSKLLRNGRMCPRRHVEVVEAATGVPKEELRPDIYPRDVVSSTASGDDAARGGAGGDSSTPSRADRAPSDSLSGLSA